MVQVNFTLVEEAVLALRLVAQEDQALVVMVRLVQAVPVFQEQLQPQVEEVVEVVEVAVKIQAGPAQMVALLFATDEHNL
jgi:hypothetical protein